MSRFADPGDTGIRSRYHTAMQQMFVDSKSCLRSPLLAGLLRCSRAIVLQQDAEFWLRFDLHWDALPRTWFKLRLGMDIDSFLAELARTPPCCKDKWFTQQAEKKPRAAFGKPLLQALESVDLDDSSSTVVEVERQHGRLRVGYGVNLQSLNRSLTRAYLQEWMLEHYDRGFESDPYRVAEERLRKVVRAGKRKRKRLGQAAQGSNPRQMFITAMDVASKAAAGSRSWSDYVASRKRWGDVWDSLPCDDAQKLAYKKEFADQAASDTSCNIIVCM